MGIRQQAIFVPASRLKRAAGVVSRGILVAALAMGCAHSSWAKTKPKTKKTASTSKKTAKPKVSPDEKQLLASNYPPELAARIAEYNEEAREINAIRKKDPKMAKARGEVLAIRKQSFELYAMFITSMPSREAGKIRKTVAAKAWYKGMPQIAFVVSMGLPDDLETTPPKDGSRLKLVYKTSTFYFEKGRLRDYEMERQ